MPRRRFIVRLIQRYWRLTRSLTVGAQAVLVTPDNRVLLIRHTYRPGWHFPGGGVERGETVHDALDRELEEEAGVTLTAPPELFGIYSNAALFPNDHVALFVARAWTQPRIPEPNSEIAEQRLFALDEIPADIAAGPARRLAEIFKGAPRSPMW